MLKKDLQAENDRMSSQLYQARNALRDIRSHANAAFDEKKIMNTQWTVQRATEGIERS